MRTKYAENIDKANTWTDIIAAQKELDDNFSERIKRLSPYEQDCVLEYIIEKFGE